MAQKYIAFVPEDWQFSVTDEVASRLLESLIEQGIVQGDAGDPSSLRNGPEYTKLYRDTDPKPALDGDGDGCDPGKMTFELHNGAVRGFAGDNLTPVACIFCEAELPYEEAQDAFFALNAGETVESPRLQMECYHCGKHTPAMGADFGRSGAIACFGIVFEGETSNRIEPNPQGLEMLTEAVGHPMTWVQVHGW